MNIIMNALGDIDENYLDEVENFKKKPKITKILMPIAACFIAIICIFAFKDDMNVSIDNGFNLGNKSSSTNLLLNIQPNIITPLKIENNEQDKTSQITNFSLNVLSKSFKDENILISPLSIVSALSMTANAADGKTLEQMKNAFGSDIKGLNEFLNLYTSTLPNDETYKVNIANSIWLKENYVNCSEDYLKNIKTYYDASIYTSAFDKRTLNDINNWVKKETNSMIEKTLEEISDYAVMYLINALSFDAKWADEYEKLCVKDGTFTTENGDIQDAEFMYSDEYRLVSLKNGIGFAKDYDQCKYSFVAVLPNKNLKMSEFLSSVDTDEILNQLSSENYKLINAQIPKFSFDYSTELSQTLIDLGMVDAFDSEAANFNQLSGSGNIFINQVIHKTTITVGEKGTQAGAVTVIEENAGACIPPEEVIEIYLNRPFFFMIVDNEYNLPIFMGAVTQL